jgi:hypothetical protein
MALPLVSLSQVKYPITKIIKKDTVVIMKLSQAQDINKKFSKLKLYIDSLNKACNVKVTDLNKINDSLLIQTTNLQQEIEKTTFQYSKLEKSVKELTDQKSLVYGVSKNSDTIYYYNINRQKKFSRKDFNTWSIQANANYYYGNFDRVSNEVFETSVSSKFNFGLRVNKQLSSFGSVNFDLYKASFKGDDGKLNYNTKINYQISVLPQIQIGNVNFLNNYKNTIFYFYTGVGVMNFKTDTEQNGVVVSNDSQSDMIIPFGVGAKYKLTEKSSINLDFIFNYYLGDDLDGYKQLYSDNDTYNRFSIGYNYQIGKKSRKSLTWFNPFDMRYDESFEKRFIQVK